jgi:peptide/nickel transport system permease protein
MSNVADSARAAANGQAVGFLPGGGVAPVEETMLDDELVVQGIEARGYWQSVWLRLRRDKLALAGGVFIVFLIVVAFAGAPIAAKLLGHGPNEPFLVSGGLDADQLPAGPWTHVGKLTDDGAIDEQLFVLGSDSTLARDEFLRLLYGAQVSLEVGIGATLLSLLLGSLLGAIAGFHRGLADTIISRAVDLTMAFPYLLFVITLAATLGTRLNEVTFGFLGKGVVTLILVFGLLGWFYSARVMRSVALSLREKEFVEAARATGASNWRIIRSHIFPHLVGPLIVLATLNVAAFILAEAGLSFLGLGIQLPTASWGTLLADAPQYYTSRPLLMVWPGVALLLTTLAFNLLGDGLRDAFDPRGSR